MTVRIFPGSHRVPRSSRGVSSSGGRSVLKSDVTMTVRMSAATAFRLLLTREQDGTFSVEVPQLPGVASQGDTLDEAVAMGREAIEAALLSYHDLGMKVPIVDGPGEYELSMFDSTERIVKWTLIDAD